ncbi:MAG TPA: hypothetical protein VE110_14190 [Gemmatimonadaceae bacterium]|nr:hypothetical protein [Gemmatimonadaceae bacterium]
MKYGLVNRDAVPEMLDDDSLEERGGHSIIPDAFGIHDDDRPAAADAEARGLTSFHPVRAEEKALALQKIREQRV